MKYAWCKPDLRLYNADCLDFMRGLPDGRFDLSIADPPYGIGADWKRRRWAEDRFKDCAYDNVRPSRECLEELMRVSKRWIIWGWNYFTDILPPTNYLIVWDKMANANQVVRYSKCEIAATNVKIPCNLVSIPWDGYRMGEETGKKKIHPHQKPVALYRWLLDWYGQGNRDDELFRAEVFDPFAGSGSCGVACKERGYGYVGCEKSPAFYKSAVKRLGMTETEEDKNEDSGNANNQQENEPVPPLGPCPRCGAYAAELRHPAYDGGAYVGCRECCFAPQEETWAATDARAAAKWNAMECKKEGV